MKRKKGEGRGEQGAGGGHPAHPERVWLQTGVLLGEPSAEYHPLCTQTMTFKGAPCVQQHLVVREDPATISAASTPLSQISLWSKSKFKKKKKVLSIALLQASAEVKQKKNNILNVFSTLCGSPWCHFLLCICNLHRASEHNVQSVVSTYSTRLWMTSHRIRNKMLSVFSRLKTGDIKYTNRHV